MNTKERGLLNASNIAVITALLPACLFPITYLLAASQGHVDWCLPFIQGCTDITHTGLKAPESHLFRFGLMTACMLLAGVWYLVWTWLQRVAPDAGPTEKSFCNTGIWAAALLALGTATLQHKDTEWTLHVIGASGFFLFIYIAQLRLTRYLWKKHLRGEGVISERSMRLKRRIMQFETALVIGVIFSKIIDFSEMGRAIEWMGVYALLLYIMSLASDWRGRFGVSIQFEDSDDHWAPPATKYPKKATVRKEAETPMP